MQDLEANATAGRDAYSLNVKGNHNTIVFNMDDLHKISSVLSDQLSDKRYTVLVCGPTSEDAENSKTMYESLVKALEKEEIEVVIGGKADGLNGNQNGYPHLEEAEHVENSMFNSIIIFASDCTTYSQLSLLSYAKTNAKDDSIDIVVIPNLTVIEDHPYIHTGPLKLADNFGKVFQLSKLNMEGVTEVVERIRNRRLLYSQQRRGRTKKA